MLAYFCKSVGTRGLGGDRPIWIKFIYSEKAFKILRNLHLTFDSHYIGQKYGEDFAKFCGLLRIYELYE